MHKTTLRWASKGCTCTCTCTCGLGHRILLVSRAAAIHCLCQGPGEGTPQSLTPRLRLPRTTHLSLGPLGPRSRARTRHGAWAEGTASKLSLRQGRDGPTQSLRAAAAAFRIVSRQGLSSGRSLARSREHGLLAGGFLWGTTEQGQGGFAEASERERARSSAPDLRSSYRDDIVAVGVETRCGRAPPSSTATDLDLARPWRCLAGSRSRDHFSLLWASTAGISDLNLNQRSSVSSLVL